MTCDNATDSTAGYSINGGKRLIVKKAIREYAENADGEVRPGTPEYADLMQNIEGQVQTILEDQR